MVEKRLSKKGGLIVSSVYAMVLLSGCGGGATGETRSVTIKNNDTNPPKIELLGEKKVVLKVGESFVDPGAEAYDLEDGNLTASITKTSTLDISHVGNYEIIYSVKDSAGNEDSVKRKVYVQSILANPTPRAGLTINEFMACNTHTLVDEDFKEFSDWIELYNNSDTPVMLGGYFLSDDLNQSNKWQFPAGTQIAPHSYLLVWADKKDTQKSALHTNFSLDRDGEVLVLSDANLNVIDTIAFPKQKSDISAMKNSDGVLYYMFPTPNAKNSRGNSLLARSSEPVFELKSGFYDETQMLTISQKNGAKIYYTLDGSIPTTASNLYRDPIVIDKTTVVRAKALEEDKFFSSTENGTYFIGETNKITLPVLSVSIDPKFMYDDNIGIYVAGAGYTLDDNEANFNQDWERSAAVEFFGSDKESKFSQNIGLSIFGHYTRRYAKKSFTVHTRDKYGKKSIKYRLFPQKELDKFTSFGIRSGGNNWHTTLFKDAMLHDLVHAQMDVDYQANQPVVLFVNGEYWGVSYLREKINKEYFKANNGVKNKVDYLELNADIKMGDNQEYLDLLEYIRNNDLSDDAVYAEVASKIDINNYLNYQVIEIYTGNLDWPNNNIRYWKERKEGAKWRWLVNDLDFAFGVTNYNNLAYATGAIEGPNNQVEWSTFLLQNMFKNETFKNRFIGKYLTHMYTTFEAERVVSFIDRYANEIRSEMPRDIQRWLNDTKYGTKRSLNSMDRWENEVYGLRSFATGRRAFAKKDLEDYFNIHTYHTLSVGMSEGGSVLLDDAPLNTAYSNPYLEGAIVVLKAKPKEGYAFVRWSDDGSTNALREVQIMGDKSIEAEFAPL